MMDSVVSSRVDYIKQNPESKLPYEEVEHELKYLEIRKQASGLMAVASLVLGVVSLGGILGGGAFIMGALFAIAVLGALYAYCCSAAGTALRNHLMQRVAGRPPEETGGTPSAPKADTDRMLSFFSKAPTDAASK